MGTIPKGASVLFTVPKIKGISDSQTITVCTSQVWEADGGGPGLYRVLLGGRFVRENGKPMQFFTARGVRKLVMEQVDRAVSEAMGAEPEPSGLTPDQIKVGMRISFSLQDGTVGTAQVTHKPWLDQHGEWCVYVTYPYRTPIPLHRAYLPEPIPEDVRQMAEATANLARQTFDPRNQPQRDRAV